VSRQTPGNLNNSLVFIFTSNVSEPPRILDYSWRHYLSREGCSIKGS